jgi:acetyl-CoA synthetase
MGHASSNKKRMKDPVWILSEKELGYNNGEQINIGWYCSDRICMNGKSEKLALIHVGPDGKEQFYSFDDLRRESNKIGSYLRSIGINSEDRVCLFLDRIPELYFSFLGILKIGAIVQPLFSAFGEESLLLRLEDAQTRAIITQKKYLSKIRKIRDKLNSLEFVIIIDEVNFERVESKELIFNFIESVCSESLEIFPTYADSPSILHYTSGTTGQPKGVKHVHYSLVSQYLTTKWVLNIQEDDIYWCTADPGWVTGTSYGIIGPWSLGSTICVLNSGFSARTWYRFIEKFRISIWYTAPTAIRSLMREGKEIVSNYNLTSLRHLASVGEPLNPEAVEWSMEVFGKSFHDTYWQTETGSIMIANLPGLRIKPGSMGKPFPGIKCVLLDVESSKPIMKRNEIGIISFKPDWPSIFRTYWKDESRYKEKFKNNWYITGDKARIDNDGYFWFIGRDDDIINTGGHLVSPFEVESALLGHPAVGESAVVAKPDVINMEVVKAFISLKPGFFASKDLELEIMNFIRKKLSAVAMPQEIEFIDSLPKTRSGKILRRLLRTNSYKNEDTDSNANTEDN